MTNPPTDEMREAFEAWAAEQDAWWADTIYPLSKNSSGDYTYRPLSSAWQGWQAALSHQGEVVIDDAMVSCAARVLCHRQSVACGVNNDDHWYVYADEFKAEALDVLTTALISKAEKV